MSDIIQEKWMSIAPHPAYEVSDLGNIRGPNGARKSWINSNGYVIIGFPKSPHRTKQHRVHVLVAAAFIGPKPPDMDVNHKDGVKANNRAENLEYMTRSENCKHGFRLGLSFTPFRDFKGSKHPLSKITEDDARAIRAAYMNGSSRRSLAMQYAVSYYTIWDITSGRSWSHVVDSKD